MQHENNMKILDFACECGNCGTYNHVPLEVNKEVTVRNNTHFTFTCSNCISDNKVLIRFKVEVQEQIVN